MTLTLSKLKRIRKGKKFEFKHATTYKPNIKRLSLPKWTTKKFKLSKTNFTLC